MGPYSQFVNGSKPTKTAVIKLLMNICYHILKSTKYGNVAKQNCVIHKHSFWSDLISYKNALNEISSILLEFNTLRTGDADLRFYITTVQDRWRKSTFLTRACFPCTIHLIMQHIQPVSEWSCWQMFIETWPHSELTFRHRASSI